MDIAPTSGSWVVVVVVAWACKALSVSMNIGCYWLGQYMKTFKKRDVPKHQQA